MPGDFHLALARRLPFGIGPKTSIWIEARRAGTTSAGVEGPGDKALQTATRPEGRYNLDLTARQNLVPLGCVSPPGLAIHRGLQPVVTTTGKGYASPSGLRKFKDIHLALARRLPFSLKPGDFHLALARRLPFGLKPGGPIQPLPGSKAPVTRLLKPPQGPEGRHTLDLVANQNLVTLGCVSPPGIY
jgi:hypothetical protein